MEGEKNRGPGRCTSSFSCHTSPSFFLLHHHYLVSFLNLCPGPLSCFSTETFLLLLLSSSSASTCTV